MLRYTSLFVLPILLFFAAPNVFAENVYVKAKEARMRAGPGAKYDIIMLLPTYYPLEYLAKYKDWYALRNIDGEVGWISEQTLGKGRAAIVTNEKANIRKGPSTKNQLLFSVPKGYLFLVTKEKNGWYKVKDMDGDEGWVLGALVWVSR